MTPRRWAIVPVLAVVALTFLPLLTHGFSKWDDPLHLLEYSRTRHLDWPTIRAIFSATVN